MIPFSPPAISQEAIDEVIDTLKSGWITTGPKTKLFEKKLEEFCGSPKILALNSATAGLELILRWYGVGEGDEVIIPAYTYAATANVIVHCGAKPVFADVNEHDFNIDVAEIRKKISPRTKVIMPVDFAGLPVDYDEINTLVTMPKIKDIFVPKTNNQKKLGRILILADSAHSIGAKYKGRMTGNITDIAVFSFHAVKNLTTAEGGAVALNLPKPFDNQEVYQFLNVFSLHGQSKDALAKTKVGNWQYDILEAGYKANMTDILASIGLAELKRYESEILSKRNYIFEKYTNFFSRFPDIFQIPVYKTETKISSFHLYPLRIKNINQETRNKIIQAVFERKVSVNVHFLPVPGFTFYKSMGYNAEDYPVALSNSNSEISLPVFFDLSDNQLNKVCDVLLKACNIYL
jgi:dTDP-4-amino-4,6-dideoxygalactose transaminase